MDTISNTKGRPKGSLNKPKCEKTAPLKRGRPFTYPQDSTLTNAQKTYQRRGFLINKVVCLKRAYGLIEPTSDKYIGKSNEEVLELLKDLACVVGKLKEQQLQHQISNDFIHRLQSMGLIPIDSRREGVSPS